MKKLIVICAALCCACSKKDTLVTPPNQATATVLENATTAKGKRIYLPQWSDKGIYLNGNDFNYKPGDTFVLKGKWSYCSLENIYGEQNNRVVIINEGGQVSLTNGFGFANCRYIKLIGAGTSAKYGFRISDPQGSGVGVEITGRSAYIEVARIDIYNKTYGYWVKQEASCIDSLQSPNWVINHISIHNGKIAKTGQEGMYLGSTDPNGTRVLNCNGKNIYPKPFRLGNIKVFNMIIDSTNRSGIQLSSADHGQNEIYNNTVSNCGFEYLTNQGNGISLGGYTHAYVHDNTVKNTFAMGIFALGAGLEQIERNNISNSGKLGGRTVNGMASIMVDTRPTNPVDSTTVQISNNTTGYNTDYGIRLYNTYHTYTKNNIICNNTGTVSVASGITWKKCN